MSEATVLRQLRDQGLILPDQYQRERRKAAFADEPTGPNQVWQLDFSEFETTSCGTWRIAGCRDYWSKFEHRWHLSRTANQFDAIQAVELALADYETLFGHRLVDRCGIDTVTGELLPVFTIVTDNGGPFRSFRFEVFIASHPDLSNPQIPANYLTRDRSALGFRNLTIYIARSLLETGGFRPQTS